ncbi:MAG: hypothetical protein AAGH92_01600 [Planctomycetota bacterium]
MGHYVHNIVFVQDDVLRDLSEPQRLPTDASNPAAGLAHFTADDLADQRSHILAAADFWTGLSDGLHHPNAQLEITLNFVNEGQPLTVDSWGAFAEPQNRDADVESYADALAQIDPGYAGLFSTRFAIPEPLALLLLTPLLFRRPA